MAPACDLDARPATGGRSHHRNREHERTRLSGRVSAQLRKPVVALFLLLAVVNFCVHMHLGMKTIIEDYVHHPLLKELLLMMKIAFVTTTAIAAALASLTIYIRG